MPEIQAQAPVALAPAPEASPVTVDPPQATQRAVALGMAGLDATTGQFGHEAQRIADALQGMDIKKGKFESDGQYHARMKLLGSQPLYDDLAVSSLLAFRDG
ncbi:hypothetical protein [Acidovorax radicis]|uniref:hypothetical protein n=1 Tax=Acidovorax radicis TaxID=758826 RepID=UPI001111A888|nr:hypothetical protein [Acidovorax radicis]